MIEVTTIIECDMCGQKEARRQDMRFVDYMFGNISRCFPAGWNIIEEKIICPKHEVFISNSKIGEDG